VPNCRAQVPEPLRVSRSQFAVALRQQVNKAAVPLWVGDVRQCIAFPATRLSDDPQCYWQPPRIWLPTRKVLVCRKHFRFFQQVADTSSPRAEGSHPNPCLPLRVRPLLMAQADKIWRGRDYGPTCSKAHLNRILGLFLCRTSQAPLRFARRLRGSQRRPAAAKDVILMSKVVQLRAAIAFRGFALPQNLNLMSSDADDRATSVGLASVVAHPDDTVA
jgi:hypothetical protein